MRCRLALIGLVGFVAGGALIGWWRLPESRVSKANCNRIEIGMTEENVRQILGGADEDVYSLMDRQGTGAMIWVEGNRWIVVGFARGQVSRRTFFQRSIWERLEDWYQGRDWHPMR